MTLYTIGFAKKSAKEFFEALRGAGVKRLLDIRLLNTSHLAGFAKKEDLEYFLSAILGVEYHHLLSLAPSQDLLDGYRKEKMPFEKYEKIYNGLLEERGAVAALDAGLFDQPCCLLCSEPEPKHCHRRLAALAIQERFPKMEIVHL